MASELSIENNDAPLTRLRRRSDYNAAEQQFSLIVQERLEEVLQGKRNSLALLRRYPNHPERLGVMVTPPTVARDELRLPVVEALTWEMVRFVCADSVGGPVAQDVAPDGSILESQIFSTKFPHIVIERTDRYVDADSEPDEITWCLRRVQNQRAQTQLNRLLDAANLAFELIRVVR